MTIELDQNNRNVAFDGLFNVRDLGGYETVDGARTRWRRLYRADGLNRAEGADLDRLAAMGLRTVLDLRTTGELAERGSFPVDVLPVTYHHLPVLVEIWDSETVDAAIDGVAFLVARYEEMLVGGAPALAGALEVLAAEESYPAVFHCAAGKDRTGVLAAIVLGLVGVPDETIATDYGLSRDGMTAMIAWIRTNRPEALDTMREQPRIIMDAPPLAMSGLIDLVRERYGSFEGYAQSIGVTDATIRGLRTQLLD